MHVLSDAIPPVFVAVVILVVACVLQQKIHIVAKTANVRALTCAAVVGLLWCLIYVLA